MFTSIQILKFVLEVGTISYGFDIDNVGWNSLGCFTRDQTTSFIVQRLWASVF